MSTMESPFLYDVLSEVRRSPALRKEVNQGMARVDRVKRLAANGKASREDVQHAEAALIPTCGFNFGLLIPTFFPRYPLDQPLDLAARPFMFSMTSMAPNSVITLKAGRQVGKCADGDTEVITGKGPRTLRSIFDEGVPIVTA